MNNVTNGWKPDDDKKIEEHYSPEAFDEATDPLKGERRRVIEMIREEERGRIREAIEECGHQQDDGSIWVEMDELLNKLK